MKDKIIIAIYMRLSQDDGDSEAESNSIINQRHLLRSYIAGHFENYEILEFQDDGYSGANFNRPGITELLDKVRNRHVHCVIVKDLSRFSRDYIEIGSYLEQIFPFAGVRFIAVNDGYDSELYKGDVAGMDASFKNLMNDLYCKDISVKVKSALRVKKEQGIYANGSCTFGYRKDSEDRHKLLVDEEEAAVVKRIFQLTLDGVSSHKIAKLFNAERVKTPIEYKMERGIASMTPKGQHFEWSASTICQMLKNATYVGDFVYDKYETLEVSGKTRLKPRNEWKVFKNHHEAIIDRDVFEYVQQSRGTKRAVKHKRHPLIGKMECGHCHRSLKIEHKKNPYFFCGNRYVTRYEGCVRQINVQFLEQYILFRLQEDIERQAVMQRVCTEMKDQIRMELADAYEQRKQISGYLEQQQTEQVKIYEEYATGEMNRDSYIEKRQKLQQQTVQYTDMRKKLDMRIETLERKFPDREMDVNAYLQGYNFTELTQEVADRFIKRVIVYDEKNIEVEWKFSESFSEELHEFMLDNNETQGVQIT